MIKEVYQFAALCLFFIFIVPFGAAFWLPLSVLVLCLYIGMGNKDRTPAFSEGKER